MADSVDRSGLGLEADDLARGLGGHGLAGRKSSHYRTSRMPRVREARRAALLARNLHLRDLLTIPRRTDQKGSTRAQISKARRPEIRRVRKQAQESRVALQHAFVQHGRQRE